MKKRFALVWILTAALALAKAFAQFATPPSPIPYELRTPSADGIGKCYLGREIARVVGHAAVPWLERADRVAEELPGQVVQNMDLKPSDVVADIGAGSGYFSFRVAAKVPLGKVYAVDIQDEMLEVIRQRAASEGVTNVLAHKGEIQDARLPAAAVDLAFLVDAYHEFSHPREMLVSLAHALRPGGRLILIEYRAEDPAVPIKPLHTMTQEQAKRELTAAGFVWLETRDFLPRQHFLVFRKGG